jgi:hypothetical protein
VGVWWSRLHMPRPTVGLVGVCGSVLSYMLCFRLLGTTEWTRVNLGATHSSLTNRVCVVIVKLSAY